MNAVMSLDPPLRTAPMVRTEIRPGGVAVVTICDTTRPHNTITPEMGEQLSAAVDAAEANADVRAIVLRSGKPDSFVVGANIDHVGSLRFAQDAEDLSRAVATRFARLASAGKPVVAYVNGAALGGGFELALACTATVATDDPKTVLGLPEVKLGLMPAANGLLRVAERAGLRVAIDLGLTGRNLRPLRALSLGLVDEVVAHAVGLEAAAALALTLSERPELRKSLPRVRAAKTSRGRSGALRALFERNPVGRAVLFRRARAEAAAKTRGHYPAAEKMLEVLEVFGRRGFQRAAALEARHFGELVVSETAHRMIELFHAQTATKKDSGLEPGEAAEALPIARVAVVGAGLMGAGIACVSVQAGLDVRMRDRDDVAVGRGLKYVKDVLDERCRRGALSPSMRDAAFARLSTTVDGTGFKNADLVIEAVFEDLELKQSVVREIESRVRDTCVIASNTSSIPIAQIAEAASRPEMVLGMHYFSPVHRMPLVEVIRTPVTAPRAVATVMALAKRQGKMAIVVRDGTAFYTTRVLVPYINEAAHLLADGVAVDDVDRALVDWGFPMGPLHLLDEVGIDIAAHVGTVTQAAFGERMRPPEAMAALRLDDRKGRKNGRGFYLYGRGKRAEKRVDDTVYAALGPVRPKRVPQEEIQLRCALSLVNEALRCLDEGVLRSARDGDVGAIFGLGFPPFRGGPFRYVDVVGAGEILRRTRSLEQRLGPRFEPAPLLVEMARKGKRFYG